MIDREKEQQKKRKTSDSTSSRPSSFPLQETERKGKQNGAEEEKGNQDSAEEKEKQNGAEENPATEKIQQEAEAPKKQKISTPTQ